MTPGTADPGRKGGRRRVAARLVVHTGFLALLAILMGVARPASAQEPDLLVLSPTENAGLSGDLLIAVSLLDPAGRIDLSTLRLVVDGRDVTPAAHVTSAVVTYIPNPPLAPGKHSFQLRARDDQGRELRELRRDFGVAGKVENRSTSGVKGRLTLESLLDDLSGPGTFLRQEPDHTNTARLSLNGFAQGWKYRGTLYLTSDESGEHQPRNRYAFHVNRGWIGADLGDVNYRFSPFTLQGKRTRGIGGYVTSRGVTVRALTGRVRRAIAGMDTVLAVPGDSTVVDTIVTGSTFERDLIGARIEYRGGGDFQVAIDGVRVRDDVGSLEEGLNPKDNLVIGTNLLFTPFDRRLVFDAAAGFGFITDDISGGTVSKEELRDLLGENAEFPFDPGNREDLLIQNLSTRPLDRRDGSNLALQAGVKARMSGHFFETRFRQVGPAFTSLAAPSIQSDRRSWRFRDTFRLIRDRLQLCGEYQRFRDNLQDDKEYTTDTNVLGVTAALNTGRVDIKCINFGYRIYDRANDAGTPDSTGDRRIDDRTSTLQIGTGYHFRLVQSHELSISYLRSETNGAFDSSTGATQSDWKLGWSTGLETVPLILSVGYGVNNTEYSVYQVKYTTLHLGGRYTLLDDRMEAFANLTKVYGDSHAGFLGGDKISLEGGARYRLAERTFVSGRLAKVSFSDEASPDNDYDETILNLRLVQDF